MLYDDNLEKARSSDPARGALQYVLQTLDGFFVASDASIMLIEKNNAPFLNKYWADGLPVECADDWPDWCNCLNYHTDSAVNFFDANNIKKYKNGLIDVNGFYISANCYKTISDFIGSDINIKTPENVGTAIYFYNDDKSRQALLMLKVDINE